MDVKDQLGWLKYSLSGPHSWTLLGSQSSSGDVFVCVCMHAHVYLSVSGVYKAIIKDSAAADMMSILSDGPIDPCPLVFMSLYSPLPLAMSWI